MPCGLWNFTSLTRNHIQVFKIRRFIHFPIVREVSLQIIIFFIIYLACIHSWGSFLDSSEANISSSFPEQARTDFITMKLPYSMVEMPYYFNIWKIRYLILKHSILYFITSNKNIKFLIIFKLY